MSDLLDLDDNYLLLLPGISSWSRRVGRRIDQLRTAESQDKLQYAVNGPATPEQGLRQGNTLGRRVSRVESLRRLILGASHLDSRRLFDRKKQRYTVDKSIGKKCTVVRKSST